MSGVVWQCDPSTREAKENPSVRLPGLSVERAPGWTSEAALMPSPHFPASPAATEALGLGHAELDSNPYLRDPCLYPESLSFPAYFPITYLSHHVKLGPAQGSWNQSSN